MKYVVVLLLALTLGACDLVEPGGRGLSGVYISADGRGRWTFYDGHITELELLHRDQVMGQPPGPWYFEKMGRIEYEVKGDVIHVQYPKGLPFHFKIKSDGSLVDGFGERYVKQ